MYFSGSINIVLDSTFSALGRGFTAAADLWGTFDVVRAVFFVVALPDTGPSCIASSIYGTYDDPERPGLPLKHVEERASEIYLRSSASKPDIGSSWREAETPLNKDKSSQS